MSHVAKNQRGKQGDKSTHDGSGKIRNPIIETRNTAKQNKTTFITTGDLISMLSLIHTTPFLGSYDRAERPGRHGLRV